MASDPAIVFIGFMGAGKSTALEIGRDAGRFETAIETDALIEERLGRSIAEIFEADEEKVFRESEAEIVGGLLEKADGGAIALGGGSILSDRICTALERHIVVWLRVDADTAWARIADSKRPLATATADVERLLAEREPIYEDLADVVISSGAPRESVLDALGYIQHLRWLPVGAKMLWAHSESAAYPVYVGRGLLDATSDDDHWPFVGNRFCVTDETVGSLYLDELPALTGRVVVAPGEKAKTMAEAERVLSELARAGMTREDNLIALGGGVVGDLGGFCAHIYQRGVRVVQVPTTLVSQVDSAYGGKTGVDLPEGKNYAGAYELPAAVLADSGTLKSLPSKDLSAGFVEALKTGLLTGGRLWERIRAIEVLDPDHLDDVIFACARYKCEVVAADERDSGLRQVLNLGHTIGHAIETASGYSHYRHGEAIGLGLLAILELSEAPQLRNEVKDILRRHDLPAHLDADIELDAVLEALQRDKKRTARGVEFVLLAEPGEPRTGQLVDPAKVEAAVKELYG